MFNLDPGKLLVIAVVAIVLLGPDKLPQVARQVGGAWRSFNEFRHRMESEVRGSIPDLPSTTEIARLARSPSALLNHLSSMSDADGNDPSDGSTDTVTPGTAAETGGGVTPGHAPVASVGSEVAGATSPPVPPAPPVPAPPVTAGGDPNLN